MSKPAKSDIDEFIDTHKVVVCLGAGGVGKTTTAAALAIRAANKGRRVVVLTIDPARRLADAMACLASSKRTSAGSRAVERSTVGSNA